MNANTKSNPTEHHATIKLGIDACYGPLLPGPGSGGEFRTLA